MSRQDFKFSFYLYLIYTSPTQSAPSWVKRPLTDPRSENYSEELRNRWERGSLENDEKDTQRTYAAGLIVKIS